MRPVWTAPDRVAIRTPAKLNLFLEVLGVRPDGFHELDMIMEAIDLCDVLTASIAEGGVTLRTDTPGIPTGSENTVVRAAHLFFEAWGTRRGVSFFLEKRIPSGGGLGGGSGNAVGALYALMALFDVRLPEGTLYDLACALGSDVPFFLNGGLARCRGRGELVDTLGAGSPRRYVLLVPPFSLGTAEVYANLTFPLTSPRSLGTITLVRADRLATSGRLFFNRLAEPAFKLRPQLEEIREGARLEGVSVQLTGSGSCLFGLLSDDRSVGHLERIVGEDVAVTVSKNLPPWEVP